jgi:hypothetical protein
MIAGDQITNKFHEMPIGTHSGERLTAIGIFRANAMPLGNNKKNKTNII